MRTPGWKATVAATVVMVMATQAASMPVANAAQMGTATVNPDDVAEHRARLDRGQLVRVADEDEPGVRADRVDQLGQLGGLVSPAA